MISMSYTTFAVMLFGGIGVIVFLAIRLLFQYYALKASQAEVECLRIELGVAKQDGMFAGLIKGMEQNAPPPIKKLQQLIVLL